MSGGRASGRRRGPGARWLRVGLITACAAAAYVGIRHLPTGTNLSKLDPRKKDTNPIEFCDPLRPLFMPAETIPSAVTMTVAPVRPEAGRAVELHFTLRTLTGDPVGPQDLLPSHTKLIHLMVVDPTLTDYEHVHPVPSGGRGSWKVEIRPRFGGVYRLFADFTPVVTQRPLYAVADVVVAGRAAKPEVGTVDLTKGPVVAVGPYRFELIAKHEVKTGTTPGDLALTVTRADGGLVPMQPLMDAFAHLVAFDAKRTGFAHMHPLETDITHLPHPHHPTLNFKMALPNRGRYVVWAEVRLAGRDTFAPFWFEVKR